MIVAVVGLQREARIVGGEALVGGGQASALSEALDRALAGGADGVISFGLCGALDTALKIGDLVAPEAVVLGSERIVGDPAWSRRLRDRLSAVAGDLAASDVIATGPAEKAALRQQTGAVATDMESGIVARLACRRGVPFAVLRAVSDSAARALPRAAQAGFGADGRADVGAVIAALARAPWELPALIRIGLEAETAFRALVRARHLLGPGLGRLDLG